MKQLEAYLRQPGLRRALQAVRDQVERLDRVGGSVVLDDLTEDEASALAGLLGVLRRRSRPRPGCAFRLPLHDLEQALLTTRFGVSLPEALESVGPPLDPLPRQRARERAELEALWEEARRHPLCGSEPRVAEWLEMLRGRGRLGGELRRALDLGARLPADPPLERTRLAAEATGDPHALDDDRAAQPPADRAAGVPRRRGAVLRRPRPGGRSGSGSGSFSTRRRRMCSRSG